ncbi:putative baseplate assembly protein [Streptomyces sp. NPDC053367]|uniref:putative baseplate assembly protein n=1 Tax=Streptomyces sp. NPDC053367 TaxID=3365700 RepID=UPI0037CEBA05
MTMHSQRGRILPPDLDDRTWQDLAAEMRELRKKYTERWTDDSPSDIGMTLIELFAWLAEGIIFRLNQVPEKNYIAFLNLMGITRNPATPAAASLTFTTRAPSVEVPAGTQAQTVATEGEAPIVFETDQDLTVLPTRLTTALLVTLDQDSGDVVYDDVSGDLVGTPTGRLLVNVSSGLITRLCLGFEEPIPPGTEILLRPRLYRPLPSSPAGEVTWTHSVGEEAPDAWPGLAPPSGLRTLREEHVRLSAPQDWARQNPTVHWPDVHARNSIFNEERFWIGLGIENQGEEELRIGLGRVLFNAAPAHTALTIRSPEVLGTSTGEPFQVFTLRNRPLHKRTDPKAPYADLVVQVGQGMPPVWETWQLVPELLPGAGKVYRLDPVTGEISFGSHDDRRQQGRGSIPPAGSQVRAERYRFVSSGTSGNVSPGRVVVLGTRVDGAMPAGVGGVTNLAAGTDGSDEEPIEESLRRAPEELKIRDRAVTAEDFAFLAREATSDVRISRCLPPHPPSGPPWTFGGIDRAPGNVNVIVVPDQGERVARPEPPPELVDMVRGYLDERRDLTVRLFVHGPRYLPVVTDVSVVVWREAIRAGVDLDAVETDVRERIAAFLHPTRGGTTGTGWEVGQHVFSSDLFRAVMPDDHVGFIERITVAPGTPDYPGGRPFRDAPAGAAVQVADYELVCAGPATVDRRVDGD